MQSEVTHSEKPFNFVKGTPAQVRSALGHNDFIISLGLEKNYEPIHHGQKIKFVYLKTNNPYQLESMAFKGDGNDADEIIKYINNWVDRNKMYECELQSKFTNDKQEGIYDILLWQFPNSSMKIANTFFDFGG